MLIHVFLSVILFLRISNCANILVFISAPSFSHQIAFRELWKELSLRGHKVVLITTDPRNDSTLTNLKEIDISDSYALWEKHNFSLRAQTGFDSTWKIWDIFFDISSDTLQAQLLNPEIQNLIHNKEKFHFDLVIGELAIPEILAFGKIYNCPTVVAGTIGSTLQMNYYSGNPTHPAIHSDMNLPYIEDFTFKERLFSTLFNMYLIYSEYYRSIPVQQRVLTKFFGNYTNVTVAELHESIALLLVNLSPELHGVRAVGPTTVYVGGANHLMPLKPLPEDLRKYLDSAKDGFIYFSLGGNVKSKQLSGQKMNAIIETFKALPYKILWKFEADDLPDKPQNVKLVKWTPQQDILRHPNIKLFICQGGMFSIEEAIFSHVPLIVMPFFGDQFKNAKIVEAKGIGKFVEHNPVINQEHFTAAIREVISNEKYKKAVKKLADLMQDRPMTGLELSIWWIEYVIRHNGTKHLRNPAADLPLYKYFLLDVIGFLLLTVVITMVVFVAILKFFVSILKTFFMKSNRKIKIIKSE